jgi:hypothetical protein
MMRTNIQTIEVCTVSQKPEPADAAKIRSRLLNRLGITKDRPSPSLSSTRKSCSLPKTLARVPVLRDSLKDDHGRRDKVLQRMLLESTSSSPSSDLSMLSVSPGKPVCGVLKRPRLVSFETSVEILPIPKHEAYSDRIRSSLWPTGTELKQNIARNCIEYVSVGWTSENVLDEDEMIVAGNGELVHPVHWIGVDHALPENQNLHWHFCAMRAQQQQLQQK